MCFAKLIEASLLRRNLRLGGLRADRNPLLFTINLRERIVGFQARELYRKLADQAALEELLVRILL